MQVDDQFLQVHPRTALWWEQRKQCAGCKHQTIADAPRCQRTPGLSQVVKFVKRRAKAGRPRFAERGAFCVDAREPGMPCGPEAKMFEAA